MGRVLIIGAGGVATVAAHKVAQHPEVFDEIMIASRTQSKCDAIVKAIGNPAIKTAKVDADSVEELVNSQHPITAYSFSEMRNSLYHKEAPMVLTALIICLK